MNKSIIKMTYTALFIALGLVLPMVFHMIPHAGNLISPMHIPVLLCGLICGFPYGILCGVVTPLLSSLLTGMPNVVSLPSMLCELAAYGLVSALLMQFVRTKNIYADIYISLIGAMLAGRLFYGLVNALIFRVGQYSLGIWATAAFLTAIPGVIAQLILIPLIIITLQTAKLTERKYPLH